MPEKEEKRTLDKIIVSRYGAIKFGGKDNLSIDGSKPKIEKSREEKKDRGYLKDEYEKKTVD